jgi:delta14-sterol reductase
MLVCLPSLVYYAWLCVDQNQGALIVPRSLAELEQWLARIPGPTTTSIIIYLAWFGFQVLLQLLVPGRWVKGTQLADGTRHRYKMNGWLSFWITWLCLGGLVLGGWLSPTLLHDHFGPLLATVNLFVFILSLFLYFLGRRSPRAERVSGDPLTDFCIGASLNPRRGDFDFKFFCESRPGLVGWVAVNLSLAAKQYQLHGQVTAPMILVNAFHILYVADYFFHEEAILTTWDIKHENFGWMLCWGDLLWVPAMYSLQAYYLLHHTHDLSAPTVAGIVALNLAGYYVFRSSNLQKHRFRTDPARSIWGKKPDFLQTARGTRLLVSGWWGIGRHINYLGDLMMGLAWCLPCGFLHPLPYFYITYFVVLLVDRERRDHRRCAEHYGADWAEYCRRVRWRILPGVY